MPKAIEAHEGCEVRFGDYLIGYFDVLGQSNRLLEFSKAPPEREDAIQHLKQTVGVILGVRRCFEQYFEAEEELSASLPLDARGILNHAGLVHWGFSDTYIVAVALRGDDQMSAVIYSIYRTICAASLTWLVSLSRGHPLRGGIEIGPAADIGPAEVYGPALVEAHRLESRIAEYPRIMVGPRCLRLLQDVAHRDVAHHGSLMGARTLSRSCLRLLCEIKNEHAMLDSLGADFLTIIQNKEQTRSTFQRAHEYVSARLRQAEVDEDAKLTSRYQTLQRYFRRSAAAAAAVWSSGSSSDVATIGGRL